MSDTHIGAGASDALIEEVIDTLRREFSSSSPRSMMSEGMCEVERFAATLAVNRLRAGGISDLTIRICLTTPHKSFREIKDGKA